MSLVTAVLAETEHARELPMDSWLYGLVALVILAALGFVVWSYRDVANRHAAKAEAYAKAHSGEHGHGGH